MNDQLYRQTMRMSKDGNFIYVPTYLHLAYGLTNGYWSIGLLKMDSNLDVNWYYSASDTTYYNYLE